MLSFGTLKLVRESYPQRGHEDAGRLVKKEQKLGAILGLLFLKTGCIFVSDYPGVMYEHIGSVFVADKPIAFGVVEPLDPALHFDRSSEI